MNVTPSQYHEAIKAWGANCGIVSFCALLGRSFDKAKEAFMPRFARDGCVYTDHMRAVLTRQGIKWRDNRGEFPDRGLVTVRWSTKNDRTSPAHWLCCSGGKIFDGYSPEWRWMSVTDWERGVLPDLAGGHVLVWTVGDAIRV